MAKSNPEDLFAMQLGILGVTEPTREYRFAPPRRWRFDFAWVDRKIAFEIEGGTWVSGDRKSVV